MQLLFGPIAIVLFIVLFSILVRGLSLAQGVVSGVYAFVCQLVKFVASIDLVYCLIQLNILSQLDAFWNTSVFFPFYYFLLGFGQQVLPCRLCLELALLMPIKYLIVTQPTFLYLSLIDCNTVVFEIMSQYSVVMLVSFLLL